MITNIQLRINIYRNIYENNLQSLILFIYETEKNYDGSADDLDAASVGNLTAVFLYDIQY